MRGDTIEIFPALGKAWYSYRTVW
ncbi:MAG: hypothetical protein R2741_06080 [Methanolobus sp.]